ncbi:MAG: triose-phosphate isomerase [Gammaproteobacteria bacterium]|nr:triose-phosphate isomerase [Gammaproteobacteria bacterium]
MRKPIIAGNWKMNGSRSSIKELLDGVKAGMGDVKSAEVAVCAPAIYLADVSEQLSGSDVAWGGQNLSTEASGAFTGEISADMLLDFNSKFVIVGHSERRTLYGETDELVAEKFEVARKAGLTPILCIGESLEERESGVTNDVCGRQINAVIERSGVEALADGVIAYEPIWAIGTGKTATPEMAQETHASIRKMIAEKDAAVADKVRIQYGGSMNAGNAAELLAMEDIDGGLIGGASLKAEDFLAICKAAG